MAITRIMGINVSDRKEVASDVQNVLTKYGCSIRTRLGLHEPDDDNCGVGGLIIIELTGDPSEWEKLENELSAIKHTELNKMDFEKKLN
ncbi:MAG: hypothetical protein H6541_12250 [Lentimicrobiaceae bacterium]|nr:hypothetical protein [Lentimicrobiaceae bacterium]MCB9024143.1 hypothetical protein [Lentimicrobiaceae bacterium]MCO5264927.1 hypothetical protein [Lentimicrobium sp.]